MNISRHNYEELFLLYVDNELSDTEKNSVHEFLQQNPDLRQEFLLLQQAILKPSAIIFDDKTSLFKKEISIDEIQESLLLLLDNEITTAEKKRISDLIVADDSVAKEWALWQQTKLQPDAAIYFADKRSLYRTAPERVIVFNWMKIAVAAVFIGFGIWITVPYFIKKDTVINITALKNNTDNHTKIIVSPASVQTPGINKTILKDTAALKIQQQTFAVQPVKNTIHKINSYPASQKNNNIVAVKTDAVKKVADDAATKNYFDIDSNKTIASNVSLKKLNDKVINQNDIVMNTPDDQLKKDITPHNVYASDAALNDNTDASNDDNHILFIPEKQLAKTTLGTLFTKVRKTLKGNAGVNRHKSIHIANYEFAIQ